MTDHTLPHPARRALTSLSRNGVRGTLERVHRYRVAPLVRKEIEKAEAGG